MYVIFLNNELYGLTDTKEKAYKTIKNFIETTFKEEEILGELIENLDYSMTISPSELSDDVSCWAIYTNNIF